MPKRTIHSAPAAALYVKCLQQSGMRQLHATELDLLRSALRRFHPEGHELADKPTLRQASVMGCRLYVHHLGIEWVIKPSRFAETPLATFVHACRLASAPAIAQLLDARDPATWGIAECPASKHVLIRATTTMVIEGRSMLDVVRDWLQGENIQPTAHTVARFIEHARDPSTDAPAFCGALAERFRAHFMRQDLKMLSTFAARRGHR